MKHLEIALKEYGNKATFGKETNEEILKYFKETGFNYIDNDETPWCAVFLNWVLLKSNIKGTKSLLARSFLKLGKETKNPSLGDIVILWRINKIGIYGHVGFFIKEKGNLIWILGGNQDNQVKIDSFSKDQLLGYRKIN